MKRTHAFFKKNCLYQYSLIILILTVLVPAVYADSVPNSFTAGTVAKSSEVNENFNYLSDRSWDLSGNDIYYDNGNVGIGTTSPGEKLSVAGTIESTSGGVKFPDGSVQTTAVSGGGFGAWESRSADTAYQAATDGFVLVTSISGADKHVYGYTDSSNPPTTLRIHDAGGGGGSHYASFTMPVRKNDYWKATGHIDFIYWISVGN